MVRFRVVKNKRGMKDIHQVPTGERRARRKEEDFADLDAALEAEDAAAAKKKKAPAAKQEQSPYLRLKAGMHENTVEWAKGWIGQLSHPDQATRLITLERAHPKYEGGRAGLIQALEERHAELTAEPETPQVAQAPSSGLPCDECDFTAGSEAGLKAHMEAHHAGA